MRRDLLRVTRMGAAVGGAGFAALGVYLNSAIGAGLFANPGPLAMLTLVGATVGGLAAPLLHREKGDAESPSGGRAGGSERERTVHREGPDDGGRRPRRERTGDP